MPKSILTTKQKYGLDVHMHDFSQKQFEQYQKETIKASRDAYFAFSDSNGVTASAFVRGETVRTAIRLEIISVLTIEEVDNLKPYIVTWIADELRKHVTDVTTEPADPNS